MMNSQCDPPRKFSGGLAGRYRGSLLGLAAGDALGTTLEFKAPGSFEPVKDIVGGGPFNLRPGDWTDDTSIQQAVIQTSLMGILLPFLTSDE